MKLLLTSFALMFASASTMAADIEAGKASAATCAACHGAEGISANPEWPNLAGQQEVYLANQLKAFKSGERNSPLMGPMAQPLSDDDIANLAAYFASL